MHAPKQNELQNKLGTVVVIQDSEIGDETVELVKNLTTQVETSVHLLGQESNARIVSAMKEELDKKKSEVEKLKTEIQALRVAEGEVASKILGLQDTIKEGQDIKRLEADADEILKKLVENNKQNAALKNSKEDALDKAFKDLDNSRRDLETKINAIKEREKAILKLQKEHAELDLSIASKVLELKGVARLYAEDSKAVSGRDEAELAKLLKELSVLSKNVRVDETFGIDKNAKGNHIVVVKTADEAEKVVKECESKFAIERIDNSVVRSSNPQVDGLSLTMSLRNYQRTFEGEKKVETPAPVNDNAKTDVVDKFIMNTILMGEVVKNGKWYDLFASIDRELGRDLRSVLVKGASLAGSPPLLAAISNTNPEKAGSSCFNLDLYNAKKGVDPVLHAVIADSVIIVLDDEREATIKAWAGSKSLWTKVVGTVSDHGVYASK